MDETFDHRYELDLTVENSYTLFLDKYWMKY
jgi:hypothetical protein